MPDTMPPLPPDLRDLVPPGERVLWQGRPATLALAREAFGIRWVAAWFALVAAWKFAAAATAGGLLAGLALALPYAILGVVAVAILLVLAWAQARGALYVLTTRRVLIRAGAALQVSFNLPYRQIASASLALRPDGTGTIALVPSAGNRIALLTIWPHARPWRLRHPEPAFRCIRDAAAVAAILAEAAETTVAEPVVAGPAIAAGPAALAAE
ncbi:MAG: photosynthetic complex putative assembly protein PuhB [Rhodobacteraceae bacterium]|nr:photosynthetic complex putative assembly protein PuhB [Paracoccaceae bacterium]